MNFVTQVAGHPPLKKLLTSYLVLCIVDTIHHLHAALALGHETAMHAVVTNIMLVPVTVVLMWLYLQQDRKAFLWTFIGIVTMAVLIPGIYHGGWAHVVKLLLYAIDAGYPAGIELLLNSGDFNDWFYELSGIADFGLALSCAYYLFKYSGRSASMQFH